MPDDTLGCCKVMLGSCKDDGGMGGTGTPRVYINPFAFSSIFLQASARRYDAMDVVEGWVRSVPAKPKGTAGSASPQTLLQCRDLKAAVEVPPVSNGGRWNLLFERARMHEALLEGR